ncbi:hypothetical protein IG197_09035 [Aminobacter sp. SR38]|jgi:hypothetical protein|uniref:Uncharacterized protein n=1 Tax=Aminobacter aminovorans TaxID=83263 RepID=A0A380WR19_AMIAI|nr:MULTISPECIES: hypothetical protein [Aminobacter]QOF73175.1 hypothetical protein IG197_09035 [Aminobacter sp. SR38]TCS30558.1 hypothetical protein EDC40_101880 [Aminobacter aminovorans]SUU91407.1 Uncharacterised protein [Aminobacter aminovorans]
MSSTKKTPSSGAEQRQARLAAELRANLMKRKAQARSRRTGEADTRPEGLAASEGEMEKPEKA